ncbi:MAG: DNA-directed RNA polymerase subunit beta', partial [Candidatus Paceibacterota bacterium]
MSVIKRTNPLKEVYTAEFDAVKLSLVSPEKIKGWSWGEVTKPETINYRTQRSEKNGLFDEKIFGPERDYECYCGKYRGIRYKGIVCEKCGVEVTRSIVRRERMGHIDLATPVSHIWFLRGVPSRMALLLGVKQSDLEKVIYFAGYIITEVDEAEKKQILTDLESEYKAKRKALKEDKDKDKLKKLFQDTKKEIEGLERGQILEDTVYNKFAMKYGSMFDAGIGAEAIYEIFKNIDLEKLLGKLQERYTKTRSKAKRKKLRKRLGVTQGLINSGARPEWTFLKTVPVLPPALRPMVALEGGRHATSDVNDLYRRVINRNNRLKKLIAINAPHVILRNEKRILQEAVDALLDNSIRRGGSSYASSSSYRRPLKSLADNLKGKQGIFRQNLLGKRVDYSGRSVIVIGPDLAIDECGLPKHMALELFRPFVIAKLLESELAYNIRGANKMIDDGVSEVWAILEDVIKDKHVLLNRAPTLHRLGIQAFKPRLVEGLAIQVHPLICPAFNADFDGDQMAVHVPLSKQAQEEARLFMSARTNILKPGNGEIITNAAQDIILGCFWMTKIASESERTDGDEVKHFPSPNQAITSYDFGEIDLRSRIKVLPTETAKYEQFEGVPFETSVGRLLFNSVLPSDFPFVNEEITKKKMHSIVRNLIEKYGLDDIAPILDKVKKFGFKYSTFSGATWGIDDIKVPEGKKALVEKARKETEQNHQYYNEGLLSEEERTRQNIVIWQNTKQELEKLVEEELDPLGSLYDMITSGARGSIGQVTNMAGMKGLIASSKGDAIEFPIVTSIQEGHSPIEYFITTHGSRKGLTDTALNTAKAGYLTRKLFDVSQDVVVQEEDCGTKEGVVVREENLSGIILPLIKNIRGRYLAEDIKTEDGETLFKKGHFINDEDARAIEEAGVKEAVVRSVMTCDTLRGVCKKCYGMDLSNNNPIEIGEAIGTIAAQAIGEPGTQLTMRTFHAGGTASVGGDIVMGLPRVEEVFERRNPKNAALISPISGTVEEIEEKGREKIIKVLPD